jgi:glucose/arabinose dehydrogenase
MIVCVTALLIYIERHYIQNEKHIDKRMNMKNSVGTLVFIMTIGLTIFYTGYILNHVEAQQSNTNSIESKLHEQPQVIDRHLINDTKFDLNSSLSGTIYSNPDFIFLDNESNFVRFGTASFWKVQSNFCNSESKCISDFSTGWKDNSSFQFSTIKTTKNTWSTIHGGEIDVKPFERYELTTHMKLNKWTNQSHIAIEGYNKTKWYQIDQCPQGMDGPLEWNEFKCTITIPENTTKTRLVLNGGWSSELNKVATTWFDSIRMVKPTEFIVDPHLKIEVVYSGLEVPTNMAFLGPNDILVLEKDKGTLQRIINGVKLGQPLLDLEVAVHDGLTGIATGEKLNLDHTSIDKKSKYIFLYFTASLRDGDDIRGKEPLGNYVYRYEFVNNSLLNPRHLLDLPAGSEHNGGEILIGPDKNLYVAIGEVYTKNASRNKALNDKEGDDPDGRAGILRVNSDGKSVNVNGILGDKVPLNNYYAYGIRNSFGIDFDPVTGNLWDTENGPDFGDEINLVKSGFNSGWHIVQGIWNVPGRNRAAENPANLADFDGRGKYSEPEFTWNQTVGPTAVKFLSTDKLGKQYENDMFVADAKNGRIYDFNLNQNRTGLLLQDPLNDNVADNDNELGSVVFAQGFGTITDIEIGPDGYLYFISLDHGKIYRIVPGRMNEDLINSVDQFSNTGTVQLTEILSIVSNSSIETR